MDSTFDGFKSWVIEVEFAEQPFVCQSRADHPFPVFELNFADADSSAGLIAGSG